METLRVGIVGLGVQGRGALASALMRVEGTELAAGADADPERAEAFAREFGLERSYTDHRRMLAETKPDLVLVATMPNAHCEVTIDALMAGAHVLCEKPFAMNAAEASRMIEAAGIAGKRLTVGFNQRFGPDAQALRSFVESGAIGAPLIARVRARWHRDIPIWSRHWVKDVAGGGVLASSACHNLDLALWIIGHPTARSVLASAYSRFAKVGSDYPQYAAAHGTFDAEDHVSAFIRLSGGAALQLDAFWLAEPDAHHDQMEIIGEHGGAQIAPLKFYEERNGQVIDRTPSALPSSDTLYDELAHFVRAIRENLTPMVTADEALNVQRITDAVYVSAEEGREITITA